MSDVRGVVYTKRWIVDLILDIAGYTSDKSLWKQVILEPSCGKGAFLEAIVERLLLSARRDGRLSAEALMHCVVSYDLDPVSVAASRERLRDLLSAHGLPGDEIDLLLTAWVRCEDFILAETPSCDYVVGNPPYMRATGIAIEKRREYCLALETATMGGDLYIGFIEKGLKCLVSDGALCYICPDRWLQNQYGRKLRAYVAKHFHIDAIVRMHEADAFESDVSAYPAIVRIDGGAGDIKYIDCAGRLDARSINLLRRQLMSDFDSTIESEGISGGYIAQPEGDSIIPLSTPEKIQMISRLVRDYPAIEETGVKIGIGMATGRDEVFIVHDPDLVERERLLPAFNMKDARRGRARESWIVNPWNPDGTLASLDDYPRFKAYLSDNQASLCSRHIARREASAWYRTIDKVNWEIMGREMLLFPDIAAHAAPVFSDGERYPCHNCYWLVSDRWNLKALGGLLMSDLAEAFIDALGVKMRGKTMRFQAQYLRLIHVPPPERISAEVLRQLENAFVHGDRVSANRATRVAYGME